MQDVSQVGALERKYVTSHSACMEALVYMTSVHGEHWHLLCAHIAGISHNHQDQVCRVTALQGECLAGM